MIAFSDDNLVIASSDRMTAKRTQRSEIDYVYRYPFSVLLKVPMQLPFPKSDVYVICHRMHKTVMTSWEQVCFISIFHFQTHVENCNAYKDIARYGQVTQN